MYFSVKIKTDDQKNDTVQDANHILVHIYGACVKPSQQSPDTHQQNQGGVHQNKRLIKLFRVFHALHNHVIHPIK